MFFKLLKKNRIHTVLLENANILYNNSTAYYSSPKGILLKYIRNCFIKAI